MQLDGYKWRDKDSSTNRTFFDKMRCIWKLKGRCIKYGRNVIVKPRVEIKLTDNAILRIGNNVILNSYCFLQLTKPKPKLLLEDYVSIGRHCVIAVKGTIKIGKFTRIGPYCQINDQDHAFVKDDLIMNQEAIIKDVTIGEDCWLGSGVRILKGVTIGDGVVIGAGSVITKDIPSYEIWGGVSGQYLRKRV